MRINNTHNINFGSARFNLVSVADTHGDILGLSQVIKTIEDKRDDVFEHKDEPSTQNAMAIVGDFFMNPAGKGILTNHRKTFGDIQFGFLTNFVEEIKRNFNGGAFEALYTPGNHCFGAGDDWLYGRLYDAPITTVFSNVDLKKSPYLAKIMKKAPNFVSKKEFVIPDDKRPEITNHVMYLGLSIPSLYYNMKNIEYTKFLDETTKNDVFITKSELKETIKMLRSEIAEFKERHPNGVVVVGAHIGNRISKMLTEEVSGIDVVLNAHDHKDYALLTKNTQIFSLGQNNNFVRSLNFVFDDDGKLEYIKNRKLETAPYIQIARQDSRLQKFIKKTLKKDLDPLVRFDKQSGKTEDMLYSGKIRYQNSILANYITTAIKRAAKRIYPELDIVGLPSTIIRGGLKSNPHRSTFNNIDLLSMFKGADESVAGLRIGTISGAELGALVLENVINNLKSPTRNGLIQWSDIQINKTFIGECLLAHNKKACLAGIKFRNQRTGEFEPIDVKKEYTVLLPDKYLLKKTSKIRVPARIVNKFSPIDETYITLFKNYLDYKERKVRITEKMKEQRIL